MKELVTVMSEPLAVAWEYVQGGPEGQEGNKHDVMNRSNSCLLKGNNEI